jgi:hypothetical protein
VAQAHIHIAQKDVNGAIVIWLCGNVANTPPGIQPCPPSPAMISGTATAANVIPQTTQGIGAGEFADVLRALRRGDAYANVHSSMSPGGELRSQIKGKGDR